MASCGGQEQQEQLERGQDMGFSVRSRSSLASHLRSRSRAIVQHTLRTLRGARRSWRAPLPLLALLALVLPATLAACGSGGGSNSGSDTLVFGAPVSLTGSLSHE